MSKHHKHAYEERSALTQHVQIEDYPEDVIFDKNKQQIKLVIQDGTLKSWVNAGTLAKYMGIHMTKSLHLTIPVHFVFVGFNGEGNQRYNLDEELMIEWFQHIEHSIKSVIVPLGEEATTTDEFETPDTHIEFSFDIQVSKVDSLVNSLVEDAIFWHLRSDSRHYNDGFDTPDEKEREKLFYTNPYLVSSLLSSLSEHLNIHKRSYTVFILNPNHPETQGTSRYGYRVGFADEELAFIFNNTELTIPKNLSSIHSDYEFATLLKMNNPPTAGGNLRNPFMEEGEIVDATTNLKFKDLTKQSGEWALKMEQLFKQFRQNQSEATESASNCYYGSPDGNEDRWICATLEMLEKEHAPILDRAKQILAKGSTFEQLYIALAHQHFLGENCLVDSWISHKRFAFIDLTAGPFEWGPTIGGNGLKMKFTQPVPPTPLNSAADEQLRNTFVDAEYLHNFPTDPVERKEKIEQELIILQTIYDNTCLDSENQGQETNVELCTVLKRNMDELISVINTNTINPNSFDEINMLTGNFKEEKGNYQEDEFISKLGSVLSQSLRHLVTQPLPLFKIKYFNRVSFHVFIIHETINYNPRDYFNFNYEHFKHEIEKLKVPGQEFTFTIKSLSMADDKSLALAYKSSLKTNVSPLITEEGDFTTRLHHYIDSKEMKYQLTRLNPDHRSDEMTMESKYIPIFIFALNTKHPVFIDKTHQAKALSNMVIAVQTQPLEYPTSFSCNGKTTYQYLNNPMSAILGATALNLGGLIFNHLSYSEAQKSAVQNWQWSVGDSPLSKTFTFPYTYFSEFQRDSIFRNYIVSSLDRSVLLVNQAYELLQDLKTTPNNLDIIKFYSFDHITLKFAQIRDQWRSTGEFLEQLDFSEAIQTAIQSEKNAYL
eukprot:gene5121-6375_t